MYLGVHAVACSHSHLPARRRFAEVLPQERESESAMCGGLPTLCLIGLHTLAPVKAAHHEAVRPGRLPPARARSRSGRLP